LDRNAEALYGIKIILKNRFDMKIVIDARCLMEGRRTGVEEYTLNLLRAILEIDRDNDYVLFFNSWKEPGSDFSWLKQYSNVKIKRFRWPNKILNLFFWYFGWPKIDKMCEGADVVFLPNIIFASVSRNVKLMTTIHDLSFERYPEHFSFKRRLWHMFINTKRICQRSDRIIAVSDSTRNDIIELYKTDSKKIQVIHSAAGEKFKMINRNDPKLLEIKEKYGLPYKFILYLGTIEPRKNIIALVRAFGALKDSASLEKKEDLGKIKLVIAGEKGWLAEKIYEEIETSRFKHDIRIVSPVDDQDKEYFYNLAALFVYPSFFEGFGFPPLEAMKCGVPVVCSNNSSLPEVVGEAAILVDPDKPEDLFRAMSQILSERKLREIMIAKGLLRSVEFSWKKTAKQTLDVLESMTTRSD
jgi:glycosyltransferase involved in cell wall biosynthesis